MDFKVKTSPEPQEVSVNDVSRISAGTIIKGEVSSNCDIRVDGTIEGKVFSTGKVVVGSSAILKGSMLCNYSDFWGTVEGDIYVKDILNIKNSARINGSIRVNKLQVEMGAQLNGTCNMITTAEYDKFVQGVVTTKVEPVATHTAPATPVQPQAQKK